MKRIYVPRHEPEVIRAKMKRLGPNAERVQTTSLDVIEYKGVVLSSRYQKAEELVLMQRMVDDVGTCLLRKIESIWCDSKATASYTVLLNNCDEDPAWEIASRLEATCLEMDGGHNGIYVHGNTGTNCSLDPVWIND